MTIPLATVEHHLVAVAQQRRRAVQTHHGRDVQAAGENGGVGVRAPEFGHEPRDALMLHEHGVGRGQIVGVDDPSGGGMGRRRLLPAPILEMNLHAVDDVLDVVLARAQIRVVHRVEDRDEGVAFELERPFRIASHLADVVDRRFRDGLVFEHQQMGVDERGDLLRRPLGDPRLHRVELDTSGVHRLLEPLDLRLDPRWIQQAFGRLASGRPRSTACTCPIAMPLEALMPCMVNVIVFRPACVPHPGGNGTGTLFGPRAPLMNFFGIAPDPA